MIQTAYYWWKFPTTFQLSEIKIWNMASRTNIFLKCHKGIFCSNIIHRHRITLKLKFQFQYMMSVSRIFNLNVRKQRKSVKAKPTHYNLLILQLVHVELFEIPPLRGAFFRHAFRLHSLNFIDPSCLLLLLYQKRSHYAHNWF